MAVNNYDPFSFISTAFEPLQASTIFTKLNLCNAYHLVWIQEGDLWKTTFNTPTGHYKCQVIPLCLICALDVFQALLNCYVFALWDDTLVFSKSNEEHFYHIQSVLQHILENSLCIKAVQCKFLAS